MTDHFLVSYLNGDQHTVFDFGEPIAIVHSFTDAQKALITMLKKRIASDYDDIELELEIADIKHYPEEEHLSRIQRNYFSIAGHRRDIRTIRALREADSISFSTKTLWVIKIPTHLNGLLQ